MKIEKLGISFDERKAAIVIRKFDRRDAVQTVAIWNQVVEDGMAFPQEKGMSVDEGLAFFESQYTAVALLQDQVVGLYILHPNNVGRCGHIANASYAVRENLRGYHIGELLVRDSLRQAAKLNYRVLQFNAVVASNVHAYHLYLRLGFHDLGEIPGGFRNKQGQYENIHVMYHLLDTDV